MVEIEMRKAWDIYIIFVDTYQENGKKLYAQSSCWVHWTPDDLLKPAAATVVVCMKVKSDTPELNILYTNI